MEINDDKMGKLLKLIEELVINKIRIEKIQDMSEDLEFKKVIGEEVQIVSKVQEAVKKIQNENIQTIYLKLKNYFNDKSLNIIFNGEDSEFDNYNGDLIFNLLMVMIQDSINNNYSDENEKTVISASNDSGNLIIVVTNKRTINYRKLIQKFDKRYIPLTNLSEEEIDDWIEQAEIGTSLEAFKKVHKYAKSLNAFIDIFCENGMNQKIIITIPLSSSIMKAQLVEIKNQTYAIPFDYIEKVMNANSADKRVSNNKKLIKYMDNTISVICIEDILEIEFNDEFSNYVVLKFNNQMKALPVNSLLEQTDVVVRPKPKAIYEIMEFKGMTILGDGDVTMVFDIPYLLTNLSQ